MDPLSDLLRAVRLNGAYFYSVEAGEPWRVEVAAARELTPRILPASGHLISYHILTEGRCYGGLVGEEPVALAPGDVIVFPHGDAHALSSGPDVRVEPLRQVTASAPWPALTRIGPRGPAAASFVCGFLGCDRQPFNPLLESLPRRMHLRCMSDPWVAGFVRRLAEEARVGRAGADSVLTRLAELMFIELLRRYLDDLPPGQAGWLSGLRDGVVGRALAMIHGRPGHAWTLAELAHEAAASRSKLSRRFVQLMGQSPMQYLAQWRMQVAANLLHQGVARVASVGAQVGYESEAAFNRAFKKATGLAPGAWRDGRRPTRP